MIEIRTTILYPPLVSDVKATIPVLVYVQTKSLDSSTHHDPQVTMLERSLELAMALEHLHHHMPDTFVVHRDLKPDNVGFKADGTLKLVSMVLCRANM